jgi:sulfite reductase (ferredoxin)
MSDDLLHLGPGAGSANETIKIGSDFLRGTIAAGLDGDATHFGEDDQQLLKFHGSYQQDDRDLRRKRNAAGEEKAFSFMVRSRIPGGVLTADQYLAHDAIAHEHGNGTLRFTTRQGIQLHGVLKGNLRPAIRAINDSLLSTLAACGDVNRNVMACPAPPRNGAETQVAEFAHRIAMHLAPRTRGYHEIWLDGEKLEAGGVEEADVEPIYGATYLPRKFKIGVASPGDNCIDVYTQDLGFVAEFARGELTGFTVLAGGGMGSTHGKSETYPRLATPLCFARADEVLEIAETIVTIQRDYGDRKNRKHARMKYVIEERGIEWFRAQLEDRLGRRVEDPHDVRFDDAPDHLGWHLQADGAWYLGLYVESGRVADTTGSLARSGLKKVIAGYAPGVRITGQQNVLLAGIASSDRGAIETILRDHGIQINPKNLGLRRGAMACPALPTCGQAVAEAERALPAVVRAIERELEELGLADEPIGIRMTGCPNGCARPRMGDIGIVGKSLDLYDIYVGGDRPNTRLNALFATNVKSGALAATLRPVLELWKHQRQQDEPFGNFAHRHGIDRLREPPALVTV